MVWSSTDCLVTRDLHSGHSTVNFEVVMKVWWIDYDYWETLKDSSRAIGAAGFANYDVAGLHLICYPTMERYVKSRLFASACTRVPTVSVIRGLPKGVAGSTLLRLLALDPSNHLC